VLEQGFLVFSWCFMSAFVLVFMFVFVPVFMPASWVVSGVSWVVSWVVPRVSGLFFRLVSAAASGSRRLCKAGDEQAAGFDEAGIR